MTNKERIIDPRMADDGSVHYSSTMSLSDSSVAVCHAVPTHVIPVIFVPGIMGSNLQDRQDKPAWLVDSSIGMLGWARRDKNYRKKVLDPAATSVYPGGALPTGTSLSDKELKRRGWGTVSKKSYGDWLVWLQNALDDCQPSTDYGRRGLRAGLMTEIVAPGLAALTQPEVGLSYRYRLPVHAVGYNWLQSNEDASLLLAAEIDNIIDGYKATATCEQVILVTHSMGGLVARHCSEVRKYQGKILGIVHAVMPATGSATAYARVKAGWDQARNLIELVGRQVLGATSEDVTPVFAQSAGALQLLPSPDYGNHWLQINDGERPIVYLPKQSDPYKEIYMKQKLWWSLVDEDILNPLDREKKSVQEDWNRFVELMQKKVRTFHAEISRLYHPHTYAFYGDDDKHKTWGDVVWKHTQVAAWFNGDEFDAIGRRSSSDTRTGDISVVVGHMGPNRIWKTFELQPGSERGDGTVPARSGRAPAPYAKACVAFQGIDHEGAYNPSSTPKPPQRFALWAITRIVGNVKGTVLEYPA
jgi:pimeloyl-ACP methyl ester carboxylesterase